MLLVNINSDYELFAYFMTVGDRVGMGHIELEPYDL